MRPTSANDSVDAFDAALWTTFVSTTLGLEVPVLSSLPRRNNSPLAQCGCKKHCSVFWTLTATTPAPHLCTAHSGATKAHDWMVSVLGPLFRTAGHSSDTTRGHGQRRPTARRRGDPQLFTRPRGQPEPGLRAQHHPSPLWLIKPRAPERFAVTSPGPGCAYASCCVAQNQQL